MPTTIEGTPERTSVMNRTTSPTRPSPRSARKSPVPIPIGKPNTQANPTRKSEPIIPLPTPPPLSPTGLGKEVNSDHDSPAAPLESTSQNNDTRGISATTTATAQRQVIARLVSRR